MAIDYREPIGQCRLLVSDIDEANPTLTDAEYHGFLAINDGNVRLAAADALDAIATSEALIGKVLRTQDKATDGAKLAETLHTLATSLRTLARSAAEDEGYFDTVEGPAVVELGERHLPVYGWL